MYLWLGNLWVGVWEEVLSRTGSPWNLNFLSLHLMDPSMWFMNGWKYFFIYFFFFSCPILSRPNVSCGSWIVWTVSALGEHSGLANVVKFILFWRSRQLLHCHQPPQDMVNLSNTIICHPETRTPSCVNVGESVSVCFVWESRACASKTRQGFLGWRADWTRCLGKGRVN